MNHVGSGHQYTSMMGHVTYMVAIDTANRQQRDANNNEVPYVGLPRRHVGLPRRHISPFPVPGENRDLRARVGHEWQAGRRRAHLRGGAVQGQLHGRRRRVLADPHARHIQRGRHAPRLCRRQEGENSRGLRGFDARENWEYGGLGKIFRVFPKFAIFKNVFHAT